MYVFKHVYYRSGFEHFQPMPILVFYAVIGPIPIADPNIGASLVTCMYALELKTSGSFF